ncbi:MAG: tripartite tricarboxylate transporter substrate binding protein [Betaproteobacteria bacterium]|nr:tripartite tricarboxylate transporter substrate binding protein [Betaproteobacteria bacterium]
MGKILRQRRASSIVVLSALVALGVLGAPRAQAQDYPSRPITLVVHLAAGTISDLVYRIVAPQMGKNLGRQIVVENRPGANGMIAWEYVVKRLPADGYSIGSANNSNLSLPVFVKDLPIDPVKEMIPVAIIGEGALILHSPANVPWNAMAEMVAHAKANPGKLNWGTAGSASVANLNQEAVLQHDGLKITTIPYQGGNNVAILALLSGDIQLLYSTESEATTHTRSGKTKALAVSGDRRLPAFPNLPTFTELGYPPQVGVWWAIYVRPGTPKPIIDRLNVAARFAVQQQDVKEFFAKNAVYPLEMSPEAAAKRYDDIARTYVDTAAKAGLKPQ